MDFKGFLKNSNTDKAVSLLKNGAFGIPSFDDSTESRKKVLIHLAAQEVARGNKPIYNQVFSDLIRQMYKPKPKFEPKPETPEEFEQRLKMQYGSDWDKD